MNDSGLRRFLCIAGCVLYSLSTTEARAVQTRSAPPAPVQVTEQVELGRLLFWDPILSGDQDIACATCHHPEFGYADGRPLSLGTGAGGIGRDRIDLSNGRVPVVKRNAQTVLNTVFNGLGQRRGRRGRNGLGGPVNQTNAPMFWDSRVRSLEMQALEPIRVFEEMRGSAWTEAEAVDSVLARLRAIPEYVRLFDLAFDGGVIDSTTLARAIAAFQRSLVAMNSPFDRFQAGDSIAMSPQQLQGMRDFDIVGCDRCHSGPMFSDFATHAEGVPENPLLAEPDTGRARFQFRTPTLRNVALTSPYMHNGMLESLDDVLRFYDAGRSENPNVASGGRGRGGRGGRGVPAIDPDFRRVADMNDAQMANIVAFLEALTDDSFDRRIPERVPSGLPPGGR